MAERQIVHVRPEVEQLAILKAAVEAFSTTHGLSAADGLAFVLAAEELLVNTARHGQSDASAESVTVEMDLDGDAVVMVYSDAGRAFDSATAKIPLPPESLMHRKPGGLGLHIIRSSMHSVTYERRDGRNVTTMRRTLGTPQLAR